MKSNLRDKKVTLYNKIILKGLSETTQGSQQHMRDYLFSLGEHEWLASPSPEQCCPCTCSAGAVLLLHWFAFNSSADHLDHYRAVIVSLTRIFPTFHNQWYCNLCSDCGPLIKQLKMDGWYCNNRRQEGRSSSLANGVWENVAGGQKVRWRRCVQPCLCRSTLGWP